MFNQRRAIPKFILFRYWWLVALVIWSAVVFCSLYISINDIREQARQVAIEGARNFYRMVVLTRAWNASHDGVYVPITPNTQPNPYLKHPRRDVKTTDGVELTMINPAYMTRLIAELAESSLGTRFHLTSLSPIRPENAPDSWEQRMLVDFEKGVAEATTVESGADGEMLRYIAPLRVQTVCLKCHDSQGYHVGDVRGGISVSQPYGPIKAAWKSSILSTSIIYAGVYVIVTGLGWALLAVLRRRWIDLADNINELEETQCQLVQSEKMAAIGILAAGVAHEINTPLAFVISNMSGLNRYMIELIKLLDAFRNGQLSEDDLISSDFDYIKNDVVDLLQESNEGLERIKKIVTNMKVFSRLDHSLWEEADLNNCIESALDIAWNELKYKAEVIKEFTVLPPVSCIAGQINQVIMNLLINAAHSIENKGVITVRTGCNDNWAWIEVADTGRGIEPNVLNRIFDPFFTTKEVGKGTGLGLALSYDIAKKHGGRIDASTHLGQGSVFRLSLPLQRNPN